jgi:hypothetical protein
LKEEEETLFLSGWWSSFVSFGGGDALELI